MAHANYAVVKSGEVTNMIVVDEDIGFQMDNADVIKATVDTRIGGSWDGNVFSYVEPAMEPDTYDELRKSEYPSINELVVALWEGVVEERMSAVTALEAARQAVKSTHPKWYG